MNNNFPTISWELHTSTNNDVFKRFYIQFIEDNDPCVIRNEMIIKQSIDEVFEYAKFKYGEKLIGIEFDEYVTKDGNELVYDNKTKSWEILKETL